MAVSEEVRWSIRCFATGTNCLAEQVVLANWENSSDSDPVHDHLAVSVG